ncbi:aminotransferase-like domain-containing protein [Phytoactinopolyspora halotolerans]|uniref:PLP-dependent aminotransferase family protein n=1 Tax=Phytoactinopolyspora halotolerans TaxID=1981512 RepID=A0A6L9SFA3_9ACTN|nr:PLP-dependent aminotransferase family protein [Phytoactinopolyspora halotolerans]NEE03142.1 PLP-dependent aminotransferase family protein [Phytoactinopolyspora halotolerans]
MVDWAAHAAARTSRLKPSAIREILKLTQRGDVISFAGGLPSPDLFPTTTIGAATERVLRRHGATALQYSTTEGHPPLREWVAARYANVAADDVQIVSGSQQGLDLVAKCYLDPGDAVVVAAPTYTGALRAFDPYQVRYRTVETDDDGMVPEALEAALAAGAKLLYVIPNFDNPTGTHLSLERRHAVVELAGRYGVPILEDDPYGELRFEGAELPHLRDLAPERVIHAGTFSKTLVPGFRLAWLIASPEALEPIRRAKQAADLHTSTFVQAIAVEITADGFLDEHLVKIRDHYRSQRGYLLDALDRELGGGDGFHWTRPSGGMFVWMTVPSAADGTPADTTALAHDAVAAGVAYVPGESFYPDGGGLDGLRLSYSVATPEQINTGIARLGELLRRATLRDV